MTARYYERFLDPWSEFERINRLFEWTGSKGTCQFPAANVWVNGEDAVVTTEIPGVDHDSIDISVAGNTVTLKGNRPKHKRETGESYHRHELWHGDFSKTIRLPFNIDSEKVTASYKKGILSLTLPQLEADKPRKIEIK